MKKIIKKAFVTPKDFANCIDTILSNNVDKIAHWFGVESNRENISVDMLMEWLIEEGVSYADNIGFIDTFFEKVPQSL